LLRKSVSEKYLPPIIWTAEEDAASSWDFETAVQPTIRFDAKATSRAFGTPFHLSAAETVAAASQTIPYRIIRIYELNEDGASARVSEDINGLAASILEKAADLPSGVLPVGFTIDPSCLEWGTPMRIERPDEPEDEPIPPPQ
jgi:hypothetical protein